MNPINILCWVAVLAPITATLWIGMTMWRK
jgi:hypothetical protein